MCGIDDSLLDQQLFGLQYALSNLMTFGQLYTSEKPE